MAGVGASAGISEAAAAGGGDAVGSAGARDGAAAAAAIRAMAVARAAVLVQEAAARATKSSAAHSRRSRCQRRTEPQHHTGWCTSLGRHPGTRCYSRRRTCRCTTSAEARVAVRAAAARAAARVVVARSAARAAKSSAVHSRHSRCQRYTEPLHHTGRCASLGRRPGTRRCWRKNLHRMCRRKSWVGATVREAVATARVGAAMVGI